MSNSRDIAAALVAMIQLYDKAGIDVFSWEEVRDAGATFPLPYPKAVGKVTITHIEHSTDYRNIIVTTSDHRRFEIIVTDFDG